MSLVIWNTIEGTKQISKHIEIIQWDQKGSEKEGLDMEDQAHSNTAKKGR